MGLLGALLTTTCSSPTTQGSPAVVFLGTMRALAASATLSRELIEERLQVDFATNAQKSHDLVTFFEGKPRPGSRFERVIEVVDLRVPTRQNSVSRESFVVVELRSDAGISLDTLAAEFGQPTEISVPEPNPITAVSYIYAFGGNRLWVGIGPEPKQQVVSLSIHRGNE